MLRAEGDTIHRLRAELAEVLELNAKIDRGDLRRLERIVIEQDQAIARLQEKLDAAQAVDVVDAVVVEDDE